MNSNEKAHLDLEAAAESFKNIANGHVTNNEEVIQMARGMYSMASALMAINQQLVDLHLDSVE